MTDLSVGEALVIGTVPAAVGWGLSEMSRFLTNSRDQRQRRDTEERDRVFGLIASAHTIASNMGGLYNATVATYAGHTVPQEQITTLIAEYNNAQRTLAVHVTEVTVFGPDWILEPGVNFNTSAVETNRDAAVLQTDYSEIKAAAVNEKIAQLMKDAGALSDLAGEHLKAKRVRWRSVKRVLNRRRPEMHEAALKADASGATR